jgi:hypothetical protein
MSESRGTAQGGLVLRVSVPAAGGLRVIAADLAIKVAEYLGAAVPDAEPVADALEGLAGRVASRDADAEIDFVFTRSGDELHIEARCEGHASALRYPLTAD